MKRDGQDTAADDESESTKVNFIARFCSQQPYRLITRPSHWGNETGYRKPDHMEAEGTK